MKWRTAVLFMMLTGASLANDAPSVTAVPADVRSRFILSPHLAGYDPSRAPTFAWPDRIKDLLAKAP